MFLNGCRSVFWGIINFFLCFNCVTIFLNGFYRFQHTQQLEIISNLNVFSVDTDEKLVNASAARALAIYVLFPSLREGTMN